jgi:hypothetical protein
MTKLLGQATRLLLGEAVRFSSAPRDLNPPQLLRENSITTR